MSLSAKNPQSPSLESQSSDVVPRPPDTSPVSKPQADPIKSYDSQDMISQLGQALLLSDSSVTLILEFGTSYLTTRHENALDIAKVDADSRIKNQTILNKAKS